jgi:hypothetical protein
MKDENTIQTQEWFSDLLQKKDIIRYKIMHDFIHHQNFISQESKNFLLEVFHTSTSKYEIRIAVELLVMYFPKECILEICLMSQESDNLEIREIGAKLADDISITTSGKQLEILLKSQESSYLNVRKLGAEITNSISYENINEDQLKIFLKTQESRYPNVRKIGAGLLIMYFPEECNLSICLMGQESDNSYIQKVGSQIAQEISIKILYEELKTLLKTQESSCPHTKKLGSKLAKKIPHNLLIKKLDILFKYQKHCNPNVKDFILCLVKKIPKNIIHEKFDFLMQMKDSKHIDIRRLAIYLLIINFSKECSLEVCLMSQESDNAYIQKIGMTLVKRFSSKMLAEKFDLLLNAKNFHNVDMKSLSRLITKAQNASSLAEESHAFFNKYFA